MMKVISYLLLTIFIQPAVRAMTKVVQPQAENKQLVALIGELETMLDDTSWPVRKQKIEQFLKDNADVKPYAIVCRIGSLFHQSALLDAIRQDDVAFVKYLLERGADPSRSMGFIPPPL
jgi:hypothetical protein